MSDNLKIWSCKIGEVDREWLPEGSDAPMRKAAEQEYIRLTGFSPDFIFSGWGAELDEFERAVVEDREPDEQANKTMELEPYDAGILGDGGGGDVNWWHDYIRAELERAHEHYQSQVSES